MDSTDEEFNGSTSFTTKGRRTKRQRTTATSIYAGGSAYLENSYGSSASATPSDYQDVVSEVSTEEQDLANCLILLARGVQKKRSSKNNITTNYNNININGVYECKTCNRTFPSFQALGGHRTSHKKTIKPITISTPPKPKEQPSKAGSQNSSPVPPPHAHATTKPVRIYRNTDKLSGATARVHECSICGSEFPSGQALGGHMRRHRPATTPLDCPINTIDITSTTEIDLGEVKNNNNNILSLDLNLPAPSDDHDNEVVLLDDDDHDDDDDDDECSHMVETKFHVIPSPALLMDCHY